MHIEEDEQVGYSGSQLLGLSGCWPPSTDLTGLPANGAFTSRLSAGRAPSPLLDMTTTASGLICWRDFHPQEWQLASLCTGPARAAFGWARTGRRDQQGLLFARELTIRPRARLFAERRLQVAAH